jgi:RHS repeat-associated protein
MQMSKRESPRGIRGERCSILSVRALVNTSTGTLAQSITYDEFGNQLSNTNPDFQPFGYVGGITDYDTDLIRFGARDYDPSIGRWTSKEPLGFGGALNWYVYVGNDPVNWVDIDGLKPRGNRKTGCGTKLDKCFGSDEFGKKLDDCAIKVCASIQNECEKKGPLYLDGKLSNCPDAKTSNQSQSENLDIDSYISSESDTQCQVDNSGSTSIEEWEKNKIENEKPSCTEMLNPGECAACYIADGKPGLIGNCGNF